ncbi:MAG: hypothetical protein LBG19_05370 [Prevotellaceae bacterium]|jgi:hypothetical protein|nr:hypothetical protein [Prevotellaceae bacterium]
MKKVYATMLLLFVYSSASATSQCPDILIWKADTLRLFSNPLDSKDGRKSLLITKISDEIIRQSRILYPDKPNKERYFISSTYWRGYVAE